MFGNIRKIGSPLLVLLAVLCAGASAAAENIWRVSKSSGEVSMTTAAGQQSAVTDGATVNPGDSIRTGQTGRVLLTRGEETILVSPNSAIGIPAEKKSDLSTTIIQQAGSILLEVEKRNVKHFAVETPYLAAVVKGTQFRVTVNKDDSRVDVVRGQVEVSEFKSGKYALVQSGQTAQVSALGSAGLALSGLGSMSPI
jgi:ferric-dicitrate binding protein FerR (iron transport regulator)